MTRRRWGYRTAKRTLDLVAAGLGLVLASPLFLALAVWIKLDSKGPVFYRGLRVGRRGRTFRIFKFRSMVVDADRIGGPTTSDDDPRVTRPGAFIRKYKVDELGQLLNVLAGHMSLVGPRPDVPSEVSKLSPDQRALILSVRPGMTDRASIAFHNEGEIVKGHADAHAAYETLIRPRKIELQEAYVREASFWTDARILWTTFATLFRTRVAPPGGGEGATRPS
jgi:lipopolysaccharide/colanic/teichoic acid biosynthesis glycosyltransferase